MIIAQVASECFSQKFSKICIKIIVDTITVHYWTTNVNEDVCIAVDSFYLDWRDFLVVNWKVLFKNVH